MNNRTSRSIVSGASRLIATIPHDLRIAPYRQIITHVEDRLRLRLDQSAMLRKRWTLSAPTDRGTWVRIEARSPEQVAARGWGGVEAAESLVGVAKPEWYQAVSWREAGTRVWWRADETELVPDSPIWLAGTLPAEPDLSAAWWARLRGSLGALSRQSTTRLGNLPGGIVGEAYLNALIERAARALGAASPRPVSFEWAPAHADLTWANLTGPRCWLLDWADWGMAPRGLDAATLLLHSLAVPTLAARIRKEFAADLNSHSGRLVLLALCGHLATDAGKRAPALPEPVRREARRQLDMLTR